MRKKENIWKKLTEEHHIEMLNFYCKDNMLELKRVCDPVINKFMSQYRIPNMNQDDLYSVAIDTLADSISRYDEEKSQFNTFFTSNLKRKILKWMRDDTRGCRCNCLRDKKGKLVKDEKNNNIPILNVSFDALSEEGIDLKEIIPSSFNVEMELGIVDFEKSDKVKDYLNSLTKKQKRIGLLLSQGYTKSEIREYLHMEQKEFSDLIFGMMSYEKVSILF